MISRCIFLSTLSLRRATRSHRSNDRGPINFYPRSPCGERLHLFASSGVDFAISIHALLAESDYPKGYHWQHQRQFLSTLSLRRATVKLLLQLMRVPSFLSTLSLRRATARRASRQQPAGISIHALLAESDDTLSILIIGFLEFLSTLSLRRATLAGPSGPAFLFNFYPRSPCGERRPSFCELPSKAGISIHALLAESDLDRWLAGLKGTLFLSTLSLRRATSPGLAWLASRFNFYPRSPCGERP